MRNVWLAIPGAALVVVALLTTSPAAPSPPAAGINLIWMHTAADLQTLATSALPIRFALGGKAFDQALVVEKADGFKIEQNRLRLRVHGRIDPPGLPLDAEPVLTLRFDAVKGVYVVSLDSLPVTLGPLGRLDLARALGPWPIKPGQRYVIPVKGGAGIGMEVIIRRLELTPTGLKVEAGVAYFPPPASDAGA